MILDEKLFESKQSLRKRKINESVSKQLVTKSIPQTQVMYKHLIEDTVKQNGAINGAIRTKKEANAQRKAMFTNGYKEEFENENRVRISEWVSKFRKKSITETVGDYIEESLMQDIQADHARIRTEYGQDVYDALEEYTAKGNDLGKVLYSEDGWKAFEEFCKNKGIEIVSKSRPFISQVTESVKESFEDEHLGTSKEETPEPGPDSGMATLLNSLIIDEWEAIQGYNDAIVTAETEGFSDIAKVLRDIVNEENLHIGQLEQCMKKLSPNAESIDQGKVEAEEQLNTTTETSEDPEEGMHY